MTGDIGATKVSVVPAPLGTSNESTKLNFIKMLIDQPDFCLIVFGGWRILRNHFRERRIANQGSLPGMTFKSGQ